MKDAFSAYPELIFLDATYKLLQLELPTYIHYSHRIEVLKDLIAHWKRNDEVVVTEVDGKLPYISSFNFIH